MSVDVVSDVICPWCYIGKRRLGKAIVDSGEHVAVRWHPFQLNPAMPKEGISRREYRTRKFGSWERSLELDRRVTTAGEAEGIDFAFDRMERTPNTLDAHRLIGLAECEGVQDSVVEGLFRAYFTEGRDIGELETLLGVAADAGMNSHSVAATLNSDRGIQAIIDAQGLTQRYQVTSVPFFIINETATVSGAQPPETFLEAFRHSRSASRPIKLLFVCSRNKWRSLTAERVLDGVDGLEVRSAGTEKDARIKVTAGHIGWADMIFVMEKKHRRRLEAKFADSLKDKNVVCLNIPDDYQLIDPALIELLMEKLKPYIALSA
ncbi:MAG: DsbA family protein [Planctomycetaceae bacterium]|nr:DsbA family protein [Planctomycetaceae bacterium]